MPLARRPRPDRDRAATAASCVAALLAYGGLGCHGTSAGPDAGLAADGDAAATEPTPGSDAPQAPRPEVRAGFVSGTACQASAQCLSGACTLGVCSDWAGVVRVSIDTTPGGADLTEAVTNFPLLLRLDDQSFPFESASSDGADLRFVGSSGDTLGYEIERWDPDHGMARVWVLVPRIEANRQDNAILMYFGNPSAVPLSSGPAVFASFDLVLHVSSTLDGAKAQLADSSGHADTGLMQAAPEIQFSIDGVVADGLQLDGATTYLATSLRLAGPEAFSTSMWFRSDTTSGGALAAFAANQAGNNGRFDRVVWMDREGRLSFGVARNDRLSVVRSLSRYNDGAWHLVVARFSSSGQYLMVDGESVADDPTSTSVDAYSGYWRFGEAPIQSLSSGSDAAVAESNLIAGAVDEIRVSSQPESDAWVKLSFATQRPGGSVVTYQMVP